MDLSRNDLRVVLCYCYKRHLTSIETRKEICAAYGEDTISLRTCQRWFSKFNLGDFEMDDKEGRGRKSDDTIDENIDAALIENRHASSREMGEMINVSHSTILRHLIMMGKRYLVNRWVPHKLSVENMATRVRISSELLEKHLQQQFLQQLITVDEIWLYWDNEGHGGQNRSWCGAGDGPVMVPRRTSMTTRKQLATIFWDSQGILLCDTLPKNETITAEKYCTQLDMLKEAVRVKRRRHLHQGAFHNFHFLHDNARPHTARITIQKLNEMNLIVLPHPPYSPDLSPSDFYLFGPLKKSLKGVNFENMQQVDAAMDAFFESKTPNFYAKAFECLPHRWQQCIDADGAYFGSLRNNDDE